MVVVVPYDPGVGNPLVSASIHDVAELPWAKMVIAAAAAPMPTKIVSSHTSAEILGTSETAVLCEDNYGASYSGSPGNQFNWLIAIQSVDETNVSTTVVNYRITYDAILYDRTGNNIS